MTQPTDPRALALAKARQQIGHAAYGSTAHWSSLAADEQQLFLNEATAWLAAAIAAGVAPPAERPTDEHNAIWLDDEGFLYGEYQTAPSSHGDMLLRLLWAPEERFSKREMEGEGAELRLLGWSK
ncbi:hypothetical protein GCM10010372_30890 [Streptomyces tauricus]|uniref:hypothetical protein n=1 Tax=Streptomyces tauricus TaxID=68274 RepID=UPI001678A97D|nr:hypothetical protein [Streptomyces tauricus]GHA28846.1 hypothetical protein GCM10010372_30890 [Streptomyces tauricus]